MKKKIREEIKNKIKSIEEILKENRIFLSSIELEELLEKGAKDIYPKRFENIARKYLKKKIDKLYEEYKKYLDEKDYTMLEVEIDELFEEAKRFGIEKELENEKVEKIIKDLVYSYIKDAEEGMKKDDFIERAEASAYIDIAKEIAENYGIKISEKIKDKMKKLKAYD